MKALVACKEEPKSLPAFREKGHNAEKAYKKFWEFIDLEAEDER